ELMVAVLFDPDKIIIVDKGMIMRHSLLRHAGTFERRNDYVLFFTSGYRNMQEKESLRAIRYLKRRSLPTLGMIKCYFPSSPKQAKTPLNKHQFKLLSGTIKGAICF